MSAAGGARKPLDPQAREFYERAQALGAPPVYELTLAQARAGASAGAAANGPGPDVAQVRELTIPVPGAQLAAREYQPHGARGTIVWCHGGGWVLDGLALTDAMCRLLANESGATVLALDYRPAPEHRFPVALDDCFDALQWAAALEDAGPLVIGGDSAGGNLAAVCAIRSRDRGGPELTAQLLVYPITDSDLTTPSYREHGNPELPLLGTRSMAWFFDCYARDAADLINPELAPLRTPDLSNLPPAIVVVAEYDPLRDDSLFYAQRLREAGNQLSLHHYEDQPHGFFARGNTIAAGNVAVARAAAELRELIAVRL
ncbi:MAG: alpha/beta hydrolase [Solirubrobacteraceae bacterium]